MIFKIKSRKIYIWTESNFNKIVIDVWIDKVSAIILNLYFLSAEQLFHILSFEILNRDLEVNFRKFLVSVFFILQSHNYRYVYDGCIILYFFICLCFHWQFHLLEISNIATGEVLLSVSVDPSPASSREGHPCQMT